LPGRGGPRDDSFCNLFPGRRAHRVCPGAHQGGKKKPGGGRWLGGPVLILRPMCRRFGAGLLKRDFFGGLGGGKTDLPRGGGTGFYKNKGVTGDKFPPPTPTKRFSFRVFVLTVAGPPPRGGLPSPRGRFFYFLGVSKGPNRFFLTGNQKTGAGRDKNFHGFFFFSPHPPSFARGKQDRAGGGGRKFFFFVSFFHQKPGPPKTVRKKLRGFSGGRRAPGAPRGRPGVVFAPTGGIFFF